MEHSPYQEKIIKNYYQNRDSLMWQKLSDLTGELYLSEGKKRASLWKRAAAAMKNLGIPKERIDLLVESDNPSLLASLVQINARKG